MAAAVIGLLGAMLAAPPVPADPGGRSPQRFSAADLADPSFYPERGFYDIKGVTRFSGLPHEDAVLATMGIARLDVVWAQFEPSVLTPPCPATYDVYDGHCFKAPAAVDAAIERYTAAGLPVMAIVFGTPAWARTHKVCEPYNAWSDVFCSSDDPADFARFAGYIAQRYDGTRGHGRLTDFVIQNEVNLNQWFNVGCGNAIPCDFDAWVDEYARNYNGAYDLIRAHQAHAKVMISLTQHFERELDRPSAVHPSYSIKTFLPPLVSRLGNREWTLALHPYPRSVTPAIDGRDLPYATMGNLGVVIGWLRARYPDRPYAWSNVELTEQGFNNPRLFDQEQADSLCRAFQGVLGTPGIHSLIYHSLHDNLGEFGLFLGLIEADGTPKPAFDTWLSANSPTNPRCGFENYPNTIVRIGVSTADGARWTSSRPRPAGYRMQPRQWRLDYDRQPGTDMAFECGDGNAEASPPTYPERSWLWPAADCDGATPLGPVGWIATSPGPGQTPVVTCGAPPARETVENGCAPDQPAVLVGYAVAEDVPAEVLDDAEDPPPPPPPRPPDAEHPDLSRYDVVFAVDRGAFGVGHTGDVALPDGDPVGEGRAYLAGTWNRTTGLLELDLLIPTFVADVRTTILPDPIPTSFTMSQAGTGIGSLDPGSGAFRLDITVNTRLGSPNPLIAQFIGSSCVLGPASMTLRSESAFDLTAARPRATIGDRGFWFPAARGCGDQGGLDQVLNPELALPSADTHISLEVAIIKGAPNGVDETAPSTAGPTTPSDTGASDGSDPARSAGSPGVVGPRFTG